MVNRKIKLGIFGLIALLTSALSPERQQEIKDLDGQIKSSTLEKKRHETLANKYGDAAYRFQANKKLEESKRFYTMENQEREIAQMLQKEIDFFEACKSDTINTAL
jgi:hypothetical protein